MQKGQPYKGKDGKVRNVEGAKQEEAGATRTKERVTIEETTRLSSQASCASSR